jgi:hypothetical protein
MPESAAKGFVSNMGWYMARRFPDQFGSIVKLGTDPDCLIFVAKYARLTPGWWPKNPWENGLVSPGLIGV